MRKNAMRCAGAALGALAFVTGAARAGTTAPSPFATRVLEYIPAPGQFVNAPGMQGIVFNDPARALGAPRGGGTTAPDNTKAVTLGGFGGSITLGFDRTVMDDPCNPMGLDFIVFGNAYWVGGDPTRKWAEGAAIEIALDANGNGVADDAWYVVRGSSLPQTPASALRTQAWDSNAGTPTPPVNVAWYPAAPAFPNWPPMYSTSAHELPAAFSTLPLVNPAGTAPGMEGYIGYADLSPILLRGDMSGATGNASHDNRLDQPEDRPGIAPEEFYTVPDDPFTLGVSAGSGGGDAIDIAWAVESATGAPAMLPGFDFVRISTGSDAVIGPGGAFGEISTELSAVAIVRSRFGLEGDADGDGDVDFGDLNAVLSVFGQTAQGTAPAPGVVAPWPAPMTGDVNCDRRVDFVDLNIVLSNFGSARAAAR